MVATILWQCRTLYAEWIVLFYPGVLVFWLIMHINIERLRAWGTRAYWVAVLAWLITAGPLFFFRQAVFSERWVMPEPFAQIVTGLGLGALGLGIIILLVAMRQIPLQTLVGLPEIKPDKNKQPVLHSGIYSKTRNPVYLAHWLLVVSAAALTGFAANWILLALDCVILPILIRAEERELLARYGREFLEYMRRVPRFFPVLR